MKYSEFKRRLQKYPYFTGAVFQSLGGNKKTLYNQVNRWIERGDVIKLKRGLYTLRDDDRRAGLSNQLVANILYAPSYISLEYALSYYGMIPEAVYQVTSVTTKKTQQFSNPLGTFYYRNIKTGLFFGFQMAKDEFGLEFMIAQPEKALLDYLYYNVPFDPKCDESLFEDSLRLQNMEQINIQRLIAMSKQMKSKKVESLVNALERWIRK